MTLQPIKNKFVTDLTSISFLVVLWFISGINHPAALVISLVFGLLYLLVTDAKLKKTISSLFYLRLLYIYTFFFLIHLLLYAGLELYWIKGLSRVLGYFTFACLITIFPISILKKTILLIIISTISYSLSYGLYLNIGGSRNSFIFEHPNHFAYVIVLLIVYILATKKKSKFWTILLLFFALLTTQSIGALISSVAILLVYGLFNAKVSFLSRVFIPLTLLIFIIILTPIFSERAYEQYSIISEKLNVNLIIEKAENLNLGGMGSGIWRLTYWVSILMAFFKEGIQHIILGIGIDSMSKGNYIFPVMYKDPHNDYLRLFVEFGIAGLSLIIYNIYRLKRKYLSFNIVAIIYLAVLIPFAFGNIITNTPFNFTFAIILVIIDFEQKKSLNKKAQ